MNLSQFLKIFLIAALVGSILVVISFIISSKNNNQTKDRIRGIVRQPEDENGSSGDVLQLNDTVDNISNVLEEEKSDLDFIEITEPRITRIESLEEIKLVSEEENREIIGQKDVEGDNNLEEVVANDDDESLELVKREKVNIEIPEDDNDIEEEKEPETTTCSALFLDVLKQPGQVYYERIPDIHIFYYPWYDAPSYDNGTWQHWNHEWFPNWDKSDTKEYTTGFHVPPDDIGSLFFPSLGPYSSRDPEVIDQHMKWIASAKIDVVVVSWIPEEKTDQNSFSWDSLIPSLMDAALNYGLKLAFHLEPYEGRTALSVKDDIIKIIDKYGNHSAFYRTIPKNATKSNESLPLFYVYDSYMVSADDWMKIATENGENTIRNTTYDSLLIALYVNYNHRHEIVRSGFNGLYTYFASNGFSHGSTPSNWEELSTYCKEKDILFIPSVGPGYIDTRVRPWNERNTKHRENGKYYREYFWSAYVSKADVVSITSFNEWHEGSQIEPAIPHSYGNFSYMEYEKNPEEYLEITRKMIKEYFPHR